MTVFGQTLDGQQVFALLSLLAVLGLWIVSLNRERGYRRWLKGRQTHRKGDNGDDPTVPGAPSSGSPAGPWG